MACVGATSTAIRTTTPICCILRPNWHSFPGSAMASSGKDAPRMMPYRGVLGEWYPKTALLRLDCLARSGEMAAHPVLPFSQSIVGVSGS